jgi:hypothetical protein
MTILFATRILIAGVFELGGGLRNFAANLSGIRNKHSLQKETSLPADFRTA